MVITFKSDTELSYDGIHTRTYKAGEVYTPSHPRELSVFNHMIQTGKASVVTNIAPQSDEKKTKVVKPTAKK
jgi:hypothetical protein